MRVAQPVRAGAAQFLREGRPLILDRVGDQCAIKVSKRTRSPALTASIQVVCTSRIARSSDPICNLHCQNSSITRQSGRRSASIAIQVGESIPNASLPMGVGAWQSTLASASRAWCPEIPFQFQRRPTASGRLQSSGEWLAPSTHPGTDSAPPGDWLPESA